MMRRQFAGLLLIAAVVTTRLGAEDPDSYTDWQKRMRDLLPRGYVCQHTDQPLKIDGRLDDAAWAAAPWTEEFVDIEGAAQPRPLHRTRAKMLWDETHLYIGADLKEPHVWATLTKHDSVIFNDPDFEVFIDPDGDTHEYVEFEMNALNTGWDLFLPKPYKDGGGAQDSYEIKGLRTAVHIRGTLNNPADRDEGWSLEIAIPWSALAPIAHRPTPPREGDRWRLGFSRVEWQVKVVDGRYEKLPKTPEFNWIWSPQGVIDMHRPEQWGFVQFTRKPGTALAPDTDGPARRSLFSIYYAQRAFRKAHGRWAGTLEELAPGLPATLPQPVLTTTAAGWTATVVAKPADARSPRWHIREDSRFWREDGAPPTVAPRTPQGR